MSDVIPKRDRSRIPWILRALLWLLIAVLCGLLGYLVSYPIKQLLSPVFDITSQEALSGVVGGIVGVAVTKTLGALYARMRKV